VLRLRSCKFYDALAEANIHPDWLAGISIGAINAAIIAGNPPNFRADRLRDFWTHVTSAAPWDWLANPFGDLARSDDTRNLLNQMSANFAVACGATGFFSARTMSLGCNRAERLGQPASTTQKSSSARWSAWWTSIASIPR
jgi:predicted acylesterase/phospholipase RssA